MEKKAIYKKWWFWIIIIVIIFGIASSQGKNNTIQTGTNSTELKNDERITLEEFNQVKAGMTYEEIIKIIGGEGTILSETNIGDSEEYHTIIYMWEGKGSIGANANITMQGGKVVSKAQAGLK